MSLDSFALFGLLQHRFSAQGWWPVSDEPLGPASYKKRLELTEAQRLEICVGAMLTQNAAWSNAEKALANLKRRRVLDLDALSAMNSKKLGGLIRSAGFLNQKADRLKRFCGHVKKNHGSVERLLSRPLLIVRKELLSLHGIGPETADSMLLYAGGHSVLVVDAYSRRLVQRVFGKTMDYDALIVRHAKEFCRVTPACEPCFLRKKCVFARK